MKNSLCRSFEGQTHFGMGSGAKMSLALNNSKYLALHSTSATTAKHPPLVERNYGYCWKTTNEINKGTNS